MARNLTRQFRDELEPLETIRSELDKNRRMDFSERRPDVGEETESETSAEDPDKDS